MSLIAVDASSAEKKQRTGVEEYSFQIIEGLKRFLDQKIKLVLFFRQAPSDFFVFHREGIEGRVLRWPFKRFWQQFRVTWELLRRPPKIFFVPGQALPFFIPKKIKVVTTIHDLGFARKPELYPATERHRQTAAVWRAVKRADLFFTPSEFTKQELMEIFRVSPEKIVVTPLSADTEHYRPMGREATEKVLNKYRLSYKNYFLFVGRVDFKKNPEILLSAFSEVKKKMGQGDPLGLVFAGPPGYRFVELKKLKENNLFNNFIFFLDYVPPEDLPAIIAGAKVLVAPTWYEGFNIPLLEAAACGTPLVVSDIPVHHEVLGQAALFVSPSEPEKWALVLNNLLRDPGLLEQLSARGLEQAKNFSWEATSQKTVETLSRWL